MGWFALSDGWWEWIPTRNGRWELERSILSTNWRHSFRNLLPVHWTAGLQEVQCDIVGIGFVAQITRNELLAVVVSDRLRLMSVNAHGSPGEVAWYRIWMTSSA